MWLFTSKSFVSIVSVRDHPDVRLVRARFPRDIHELFPTADVFTDDTADYRYRALISAHDVAHVVSKYIVDEMPYHNFKDSVPTKQKFRKHAYGDVWMVMLGHASKFGAGSIRYRGIILKGNWLAKRRRGDG